MGAFGAGYSGARAPHSVSHADTPGGLSNSELRAAGPTPQASAPLAYDAAHPKSI